MCVVVIALLAFVVWVYAYHLKKSKPKAYEAAIFTRARLGLTSPGTFGR
jgi:hypothetical protein